MLQQLGLRLGQLRHLLVDLPLEALAFGSQLLHGVVTPIYFEGRQIAAVEMAADQDAGDGDKAGGKDDDPIVAGNAADGISRKPISDRGPVDHLIPPAYWLGFVSPGDVRSAPARKAPEIRDRTDRTPGTSYIIADGAELFASGAESGDTCAVLSDADGEA